MRRSSRLWYFNRDARSLAYHAVKYQSRDGWSNRDLMRLIKPSQKGGEVTRDQGQVIRWMLGRSDWLVPESSLDPELIGFLDAADRVSRYDEHAIADVVELIKNYRLPREIVASQYLSNPIVWEALLEGMPMTAMIRNLGKMTRVGLIGRGSEAERIVVNRLRDDEILRRSRVHPLAILIALKTYERGHGEQGKLTWTPSKIVVNALDEAFYDTFPNVESTGKRIRLAVDVSASMDGSEIAGMPITAREGAAAMALVTMAADPETTEIVGYSTSLVRINIRPSMRLDEVIRIVKDVPVGGTFCTLPIEQAMQSKTEFDAFVSYTDNETWNGGVRDRAYTMHGQRHIPSGDTADEALYKYRSVVGIPARHAVVAMTANRFSIANPNDPLQLDVSGFDTATPGILSGFIAGDI